jgi:hypothetical protein
MERTQLQQLKNHRTKPARVYPELVKTTKATEQEAAYHAALELVARIDEDLVRGIRHYRTQAGLLLTTLDEVVRAILEDNLLLSEEHDNGRRWITPQELAA